MFVPKTEYYNVYKEIQALAYKCTVTVFASNGDADALCAYKILAELFKHDSIPFCVIPVTSGVHLQQQAEMHLAEENEDRAVVLVNCGGTEDIQKILPALSEGSRVIIIDSHRPLNVNNISTSNKGVLVFYEEGHEGVQEVFPDGGTDGEDEEDDSDDEEEEYDDEDGYRAGSRRRLSVEGEYEAQRVRRERRTRRAEQRSELLSYYSRGSFFGQAAGWTIYNLAHQLARETNELLWWAIVALTDQHLHQRITKEMYDLGVSAMNTEIVSKQGTMTTEDGMELRIAADSSISIREEFCFFHLRHWNLSDAMVHSPYVATTLKTWEEKGTKKLQRLYARMGVPLAACQQKYSHMTADYARQLEAKLEEYGREVGLNNLKFTSFCMERGHKLQVSASDVALGAAALLEGPSGASADWTDNWRRAAGALSFTEVDALLAGIQVSMSYQRTIVTQAGLAISRKLVYSNGAHMFRIYNLKDECSGSDAAALVNPQVLTRFALFLQEEISLGKARRRALVVVAPEVPGSVSDAEGGGGFGYVRICGVTGRPQLGDTVFNRFSSSFSLAAERCHHMRTTFEPNVVDIRSDDVKTFLAYLLEAEYDMRHK